MSKRPRDDDAESKSTLLHKMLGKDADTFLSSVWGQKPFVFRATGAIEPPLKNCEDLLAVLRNTKLKNSVDAPSSNTLVMKNGIPSNDEYDSYAAAYLDGCSLVVNHIEVLLSPNDPP